MFSATQTVLRSACPMRSASQKQSAPSQRCVRMQADKQEGGIDFTPRTGKETGYLKEDSAGQENIFAVEAKPFQGDQGVSKGANAAVAGVAVAVGALVIVGGILFTKNNTAVQDVIPNVLDDIPTESLTAISKRLVPEAVKEAVKEAPAVVQEAPAKVQEAVDSTVEAVTE